jgi:hypothetical protein
MVEIVPGPWTAPDVLETTRRVMEKVGQSPVTLAKEIPGFALNRIQYAVINECWTMLKVKAGVERNCFCCICLYHSFYTKPIQFNFFSNSIQFLYLFLFIFFFF